MTLSKYDFEGLWFDIYRKVLQHNEILADEGLDKNQLREVTTSIFIAKSHRGVVRPTRFNSFTESIIKVVSPIKERKKQEIIYTTILKIIKGD